MTAPLGLLESPPEQARGLGAGMDTAQVLDVVERLHYAAEHPDIVQVKRYGRDLKPGGQSPAGVSLKYQSGSEAYLWSAAPGKTAPVSHDLPADLPSFKFRAQHALAFLVQLLEAAQPEQFTAWRPVAFDGVDLKPSGLEIRCKDGTSVYLRVTSGSGPNGDPEADPYPDYAIPEGVKTCLREASAASVAQG